MPYGIHHSLFILRHPLFCSAKYEWNESESIPSLLCNADYSSESGNNYNPNDQWWLRQELLSRQNDRPCVEIWAKIDALPYAIQHKYTGCARF